MTGGRPYQATRIEKQIKITKAWADKKVGVMRKVVAMKFDQNVIIRDRLLATTSPLYDCTKLVTLPSEQDSHCGTMRKWTWISYDVATPLGIY